MKYLYKFNENMAMAKSIVSKKIEGFEKLKDLLSKNIGYIGKFTQFLMEENVPYSELEQLYTNIKKLKEKNVNIDLSTLTYEEAIDKIQNSENDLLVNSLINKFPSLQKTITKDLIKSKSVYNALLKISKKDNQAFISKISRYKIDKDLKNAILLFSKDSNNDIETIKNYIKSSETATIEYEKNNFILVLIKSINDVKQLGADTSWCILGQHNWDSYTKNRLQYILFDFNIPDFDPMFKIGFTLDYSGNIYAAHDILDRPISALLKNILNDLNINIETLASTNSTEMNKDLKKKIANTIFTSRTSITAWKELIDLTPLSNIEEIFIKFLDAHKMTYNRNNKYVTKTDSITPNRLELISMLVRKLTVNGPIKEDEVKDDRIRYYLTVNNKLVQKDWIKSNNDLEENFDYYSIKAYINFVGNLDFFSKNNRRELKLNINLLEKIYDKLKDNIDQENKKLMKGFAILSKLLGKNDYQNIITPNDIAYYNNHFKEQIDLEKLSSEFISYNIAIDGFNWESYIIKKDYDLEADFYAVQLDKVLEHLKNNKITINFTKRTTYSEFIKSRNNSAFKIKNAFLIGLPRTSRIKTHTSIDGLHTLKFK